MTLLWPFSSDFADINVFLPKTQPQHPANSTTMLHLCLPSIRDRLQTVMFETMCMATVFMWNHLLSFKMVLGRRVEHSVQQVENAEWLNLVICLLYHSYINSVVWTPKKARTTQNQEQGSTWRYNRDKDDTELLWCVCTNKPCLWICLTVILNC